MEDVIIRPDLKKVIIVTALKVLGVILAGIALWVFMLFMDLGLGEMLIEALDVLGIEVDTGAIIQGVAILAVLGALLYFALTSMKYNIKYKLYSDRMITPADEEVSYQNVTRVIYNQDSLLQNLLGYGTLIIEAGATDKPNIQIEFVSKIEETAKYMQQVLYNYKMQEMQRQQNQARIQNIVEQY